MFPYDDGDRNENHHGDQDHALTETQVVDPAAHDGTSQSCADSRRWVQHRSLSSSSGGLWFGRAAKRCRDRSSVIGYGDNRTVLLDAMVMKNLGRRPTELPH